MNVHPNVYMNIEWQSKTGHKINSGFSLIIIQYNIVPFWLGLSLVFVFRMFKNKKKILFAFAKPVFTQIKVEFKRVKKIAEI